MAMNDDEQLVSQLGDIEAILEFAVGRMNRGIVADGAVSRLDLQRVRNLFNEGLAVLDAYERSLIPHPLTLERD